MWIPPVTAPAATRPPSRPGPTATSGRPRWHWPRSTATCRGAQVLNVARGGTLDQHLPDIVGHDAHLPEPGVFGAVTVRLAPGTPVSEILGAEVKVPCYHHQAIRRLGRGVEAVGWADDGTIEAAVVSGQRF